MVTVVAVVVVVVAAAAVVVYVSFTQKKAYAEYAHPEAQVWSEQPTCLNRRTVRRFPIATDVR